MSPDVSSVRYLCRSLWQLPGHRPVCLGQGHELKVKSTIRHCCRGQLLQQKGCNVTPKPAVPAMWRPVYCATLLHGHPFWLLVCHCQSSPLAHGQSSSLPVFQTQHIGIRVKVSLTVSSCQSFRTHSCRIPAWPDGLCRMTLNTSAKAMQSQPMAMCPTCPCKIMQAIVSAQCATSMQNQAMARVQCAIAVQRQPMASVKCISSAHEAPPLQSQCMNNQATTCTLHAKSWGVCQV